MEIKIVRDVLEANDQLAESIRKRLNRAGVRMFNIMSSPGSGKTTLLEKLIPILRGRGLRIGVIEGDITTTRDAERIQPLDIPVAQINTEPFGGDCHLGAEVIWPALDQLGIEQLDLVLIENVGNLVCPAEFDTGAHANLVILSVTEGEDKPLKYPLMFRVCQLAVIHKTDLLPYLDVDPERIETHIRQIRPEMTVLRASSKSGSGLTAIADWLIAFKGND